MTTVTEPTSSRRPNAYAKCIDASKRIRWDIDRDVLRGRTLDFTKKFMPDSLSKVHELPFLSGAEPRLFSQIQGSTYANMFGLVERFIGAKILEVSRDHWLGDQLALEALVRFTDEELKHQELFRRLERMTAAGMPSSYSFAPQPNEVASAVLGKSTWAVLGLTCCIELLTLAHYRQSIEPDAELSEVWKDVFLYHWREESQHAILDTNSRGHRHEENAARLVNVALEQPIHVAVALLASAEAYTPTAQQLIDRMRERLGTIQEVANALADNLPAPKQHSGKSRRRRRKRKQKADQQKAEQQKQERDKGEADGRKKGERKGKKKPARPDTEAAAAAAD